MRNAVCVCVDRNMLVPGLFVLEAARSRRTTPADYDVVLVTTGPADVTDVDRRWLSERGIRLRDDFDLSILQGIEIPLDRLTKATLLKLLLAETLADRYDKILYLDADLTIHEELTPIFSLQTRGHAIAAVPSGAHQTGFDWPRRKSQVAHFRALGMTEPYRYVNSGVMLIDVGQWNRDDLSARSLDFIRRNPTLWRLPDEDALNAVLDGHVAELSPVWNMQAPIWSHREVREIVQPAIIHYVGPNKPWKRFKRGKRLFEHGAAYRLYREFLTQSPWPTWLGEQWGARDLWDSLASEMHRISRQVRVKRIRHNRKNRRAFLDTYRRHCGETAFADVEQGIVRREGVRLRVDRSNGG
jgi:lipopolysaccharide biosynthesis glycosyltransferase